MESKNAAGTPKAKAAAEKVIRRLREAGHEALLAGGCVRDLLLGREPHDFDVATSALPSAVAELFPRTIPVGVQFGVILVLEEGQEIQVATFRSDGNYLDGRRPEAVEFGDARQDALRRDFTINGLFLDPLSGELHDYVGGKKDLAARVLRCIGDSETRFEEDRLRLLRAVRFAADLEFTVDPPTWQAVCHKAQTIHSVSAERIRDELVRIFLSSRRVRGFDLLEQSGLMAEVLPELSRLRGCEQPPQFHPEGDVFVHTRLMLSLLPETVSLPLVLAVLFHDIGKPDTQAVDETGRIRFNGHEKVSATMTEAILQRLRFSNQVLEDTVALVENHMAFKDVQNMRPAKLKRFLARPTFSDELELHRVDCLGSHGLLDNYEFLQERQEFYANQPLIPPPLITGKDLIDLGWVPGPQFKTVLEDAQTRQLEGELNDRKDALRWLRQLPKPS